MQTFGGVALCAEKSMHQDVDEQSAGSKRQDCWQARSHKHGIKGIGPIFILSSQLSIASTALAAA